jgi:hypothetical protein
MPFNSIILLIIFHNHPALSLNIWEESSDHFTPNLAAKYHW